MIPFRFEGLCRFIFEIEKDPNADKKWLVKKDKGTIFSFNCDKDVEFMSMFWDTLDKAINGPEAKLDLWIT